MEGVLVTGEVDAPVDRVVRPLPGAARGHPGARRPGAVRLRGQHHRGHQRGGRGAPRRGRLPRPRAAGPRRRRPHPAAGAGLHDRTAPGCASTAVSGSTTCPPTTPTRCSTPRWAGLLGQICSSSTPRRAPPAMHPPQRRTDRGCPEAEDVPRQHPCPPLAVEGHAPPTLIPCPNRACGQLKPPHQAAPLRPVRRPPGPLGLIRCRGPRLRRGAAAVAEPRTPSRRPLAARRARRRAAR